MSDIFEKAKQHFAHVVVSEGLQRMEVPEWGEPHQPAQIYFKPMAALPIKSYSRLVMLGSEQTVEALVEMLILRALDSEGQPVFKLVDKTEMLRAISPVVVCDIIKRMSEYDTLPSLEATQKNS